MIFILISNKYTIITILRAHFGYYLLLKLYFFISLDHQDASDRGLDICCLLDAMANVANYISYRAQRKWVSTMNNTYVAKEDYE